MFGHELQVKTRLAITRHRNLDLSELRAERLTRRVVAYVAPGVAHRGVAGMPRILVHLRLQRRFDDHFVQLLEHSVLAHSVGGLLAIRHHVIQQRLRDHRLDFFVILFFVIHVGSFGVAKSLTSSNLHKIPDTLQSVCSWVGGEKRR